MWDFLVGTVFFVPGMLIVYGMFYAAIFVGIPIVAVKVSVKLVEVVKRHFKKEIVLNQEVQKSPFFSSLPNAYKIHWYFAVIPPILYVIAMIMMMWRSTMLTGHWSYFLLRTSNGIGLEDSLYQWLAGMTSYALACAGWSVILWGGFFLAWRGKYTTHQRKIMIWTFIIVWMVVALIARDAFFRLFDF